MSQEKLLTLTQAAEATGLSRGAIRRRTQRGTLKYVKRDGQRLIPESEIQRILESQGVTTPEPRQFTREDDTAEITSGVSKNIPDHNVLLSERGLDPEDWEVERLTVNEWDSPTGDSLKQLKVTVRRRKICAIEVARTPSDYNRIKPDKPSSKKPRMVVLLGDQHAPHHDPELHEAVCSWLSHNEPEEGVLLGDLLDFPEISRFRHNPAWAASTQDCIDAGYRLIRDYVQASPNTYWTMLGGNHEQRLRNTLIDYTRDLYGLRQAVDENEEPGESVIDIPNLLRLDDLGVDFERTENTYEHAKVKLSQHLGVIHGFAAAKGSGVSALKTLHQYGHSIAMGHTHRASMVFHTAYDIDGQPETLVATEIGCLCRLEGSLGYGNLSDWQQGFATAAIYPDGRFKVDLGTFVNSTLLWRDQRF